MTDGPDSIIFRLYVAGAAPNSQRALANLTALCERCLPDRHSIEVIDVFEQPDRALTDGIFLTPQLLILSPPPRRAILGDLSDPSPLLLVIGQKADRP